MKDLLALTFLLMITKSSMGQTTWKRVFGGLDVDRARKVIVTQDNGLMVLASTGSFGQGSTDFYLMKLDLLGNRLWSALLGTAYLEDPQDLFETDSGDLFIVGNYAGGGARGYDGLIVRTDASGVMLSQSTYGGPGWDFLSAIAQQPQGEAVAVGTTYSWSTIGQGWLLRLDQNGDTLWTRRYSSDHEVVFRDVESGPNGSMIVCGSVGTADGSKDALVTLISSSGSVVWWNTYGGQEDDEAKDIIRTADGGYSIVGTTQSFAEVIEQYHFKIDSEGGLLWQRSWGQTNDQDGNQHLELSDGRFASIGYVAQGGAGGRDMFLMLNNANGDFILGQTQGGGLEDTGVSLVRVEGGYVLCGTTFSYGPGMADIFLVRTNEVGFTDSDEVIIEFDPVSMDDRVSLSNVSFIFPNPSTGIIHFDPTSALRVLSVRDPSGRSVMEVRIPAGQQEVTLDLPEGIYFIAFGNSPSSRLIIQRP
ncbi:MAG: T9SS type A sorting domain-containing protein [Flavobacteriales bacterium]